MNDEIRLLRMSMVIKDLQNSREEGKVFWVFDRTGWWKDLRDMGLIVFVPEGIDLAQDWEKAWMEYLL